MRYKSKQKRQVEKDKEWADAWARFWEPPSPTELGVRTKPNHKPTQG